MPLQIIRNDITRVRADAIVNTANPKPVFARGSELAVYQAAGPEELLAEREKIGPLKPGEAAASPAFRLPARYVIHTVGPVWAGGERGEMKTLEACYRNSLQLAGELGCESIAFPLISAGTYGFPKDRALDIALKTISRFLEDREMEVILVVFDKGAFEISRTLAEDVRQFIDDHYAEQRRREEYGADFLQLPPGHPGRAEDTISFNRAEASADHPAASELEMGALPHRPHLQIPKAKKAPKAPAASLEDVMGRLGETFQERLLRLIDERGLTDAAVYKRANVDRKLFSKIRCNPDYSPRKRTAVALAIALRLNLDETVDLLGRAGLALSPSSKFDLIVEFCIDHRIYDIFEINALLFQYDQPLLGC